MKQLTEEEIIYVFHLYYNASITTARQKDVNGYDYGPFKHWRIKNEQVYVHPTGLWDDVLARDAKLLLTPLSKITDEHAIEVAKLVPFSSSSPNLKTYKTDYEYCLHNKLTSESIGFRYREYKISLVKLCLENSFVYQYLIQQGYTVPLFFGIGHWANGKDAIELEVAIDKTTNKGR